MTKDLVLNSINNDAANLCVDFILRVDGSYVFKEFRRDVEDLRGWFPTGFDARDSYLSYEDALAAAVSRVAWLGEAIARADRAG